MMVKNSKVGASNNTPKMQGRTLRPPCSTPLPLILEYHNWDILEEEEEHMFMPQHKTLNPKKVGKISFVTIVM
jgi:hypothetical protein